MSTVACRLPTAPGCAATAALELRVPDLGPEVGAAVHEPADGLDATGDEDVALAGADRVGGHADGLERRRAVAVDGDARCVEPGEQRGDAGQVEPRLARRLGAAPDDVLDLGGIERRDLGEQRLDDAGPEVVGTAVDERALQGPADRGPGGGDDDCVHGSSPDDIEWRRLPVGPANVPMNVQEHRTAASTLPGCPTTPLPDDPNGVASTRPRSVSAVWPTSTRCAREASIRTR